MCTVPLKGNTVFEDHSRESDSFHITEYATVTNKDLQKHRNLSRRLDFGVIKTRAQVHHQSLNLSSPNAAGSEPDGLWLDKLTTHEQLPPIAHINPTCSTVRHISRLFIHEFNDSCTVQTGHIRSSLSRPPEDGGAPDADAAPSPSLSSRCLSKRQA